MSELATKVVDRMFSSDEFSKWLGIKRIETGAGISILEMSVSKTMLNGFGIAHGGITYSLADSALAFASNGHGKQSVSIETSISHTKPVVQGDVLRAETKELSRTNKIGIYQITITNQTEDVVALFKGTVYITGKDWEI